MIAPDLLDPFHKALYNKLAPEIDQRVDALAGGSASTTTNDTRSVAEKYAFQIGQIMAFKQVLEICIELEQDRYGTGKPERDD